MRRALSFSPNGIPSALVPRVEVAGGISREARRAAENDSQVGKPLPPTEHPGKGSQDPEGGHYTQAAIEWERMPPVEASSKQKGATAIRTA